MILIYFIMMVMMVYASEKNEKEGEEGWKVKEETIPDACVVCFLDVFAVSFQISCGHNLCASCAEKLMYDGNRQCAICRTSLPISFCEYLNMIRIYPIQFTRDIPLKRLQHEFPLICYVANLTTVTKCISLGVNVNTKGFNNYFPIHLASQKSVVQYLVENGADVNQFNIDGETPLLIRSQYGYLQVVQHLLEYGADVNRENNHGTTPLFMSSLHGHLQVVEYLIQNGADVNVGRNDGYTPLCIAIAANRIEVAKFLLSKNANIESTKYKFREFGELEFIEILENICKEIEESEKKSSFSCCCPGKKETITYKTK